MSENTPPPQDPGQQPNQPYQSYQQQGPPPNYPAQQPYGQGAPAAEDPGKTLGIVGLVLSFVAALIGMIISIVALRKSKAAGFKNTPALVGIIVGAVTTVFWVIVGIVVAVAISAVAQQCAQLGPGTHSSGGVTITCPG